MHLSFPAPKTGQKPFSYERMPSENTSRGGRSEHCVSHLQIPLVKKGTAAFVQLQHRSIRHPDQESDYERNRATLHLFVYIAARQFDRSVTLM